MASDAIGLFGFKDGKLAALSSDQFRDGVRAPTAGWLDRHRRPGCGRSDVTALLKDFADATIIDRALEQPETAPTATSIDGVSIVRCAMADRDGSSAAWVRVAAGDRWLLTVRWPGTLLGAWRGSPNGRTNAGVADGQGPPAREPRERTLQVTLASSS